MQWFVLALFAALSWALVNNLDKIVVTRFKGNPLGIVVIEGFVGFFVALFFLPIVPLDSIPLRVTLLSILSGFTLYIFSYLYYKALSKSDPTLVAILMQTVPLFTFLLGIFFFTEVFSIPVYIGAACIILGSVLVTFEKKDQDALTRLENKYVKIAFLIMLPANLMLSITYAIQKYVLGFIDAKNVFVLARIGGLLFSLIFLLLRSTRISVRHYASVEKLQEWLFFILIEIFNLTGIFLATAAYAVGSMSLVATVISIQPIFVAFFGGIMGLFFLGEINSLSERLRGYRIPSLFLIGIGVYLITR